MRWSKTALPAAIVCGKTFLLSLALSTGSAAATAQHAASAGKAFADHCFSPHLTAQTAREHLAPSGARIDFYDLRPFSNAAPSPVTGRSQTAGTDRRCEVAFDGSDPQTAIRWLKTGLTHEGLADRTTDVPAGFPRQNGTTFIAAAQLNPNRIAVVQVGVRSSTAGTPETFLNVERLFPLDEASK